MRKPYYKYRDWDNYYDCPSDLLNHFLGLWIKDVFIGIHWHTITPYNPNTCSYYK